MRCQGCDYPLWNLTARLCPECGRPFAPSDYDFIPNSVRFSCPHCNQDYYGTGPRGHLLPPEFDCVRCHHHITMDQMVLLPTAGVQEEQTKTDIMPWLERHKIGRLKGWFQTVWRSLFEPTRLAQATPPESSPLPAFWFAFLTTVLFSIPAVLPIGLIFLFAVAAAGRGPRAAGLTGFSLFAISLIVLVTLLLPIWAAATQILLRLTGSTYAGYGVTLRTLCYASGANILIAIPCFGLYVLPISWLWSGISAVFMLRVSQRVGAVRACIAVFALPLVLTMGVVALFTVGISSAITSSQTAMATASAAATTQIQTSQIVTGLFGYVDRKQGALPDHALRLVHENDLNAYAFTAAGDAAAQVGNTTLAQFILLPTEDEKSLVEIVARQLPKDTVAHRLGDYVFTYHGIDLTTADHNLWVVIQWPESGQPSGQLSGQVAANPPICVGTVGRGVQTIPSALFTARLAQQNQLRAAANLPPHPDPGTITADVPPSSPR
jgi:hypothetical protein